eukprot:m.70452 g.70452  ORF g.70452 m.70452 type:complete len:402 (-) comp7880_c0_seq1:219-1424(-)
MARTSSTGASAGSSSGSAKQRPSPVVVIRYFAAIATALVAVALGVAYLQQRPLLSHLSVSDPEALKEVLYSGAPWVVVCTNKNGDVPRLVQDAAPLLQTLDIGTALLDCSAKLPSGKTTTEKFRLSTSESVVAFFAGNDRRPTQIMGPALNNADVFVKKANELAQLVHYSPKSTSELQSSCLGRKKCVLVLSRGGLSDKEKRGLKKVMRRHRSYTYAIMDLNATPVPALEKLLPAAVAPPFLAVTSRSSRRAVEEGKKVGLRFMQRPFSSAPAIDFIAESSPSYAWLSEIPEVVGRAGSGRRRTSPSPPSKKAERQQARERARTEAESADEARERERQRRLEMDQEAQELFTEIDRESDTASSDGNGDGRGEFEAADHGYGGDDAEADEEEEEEEIEEIAV